MAGKRRCSVAMMSFVSSTDSVVCVVNATLPGCAMAIVSACATS
jgi:hypothetical protein